MVIQKLTVTGVSVLFIVAVVVFIFLFILLACFGGGLCRMDSDTTFFVVFIAVLGAFVVSLMTYCIFQAIMETRIKETICNTANYNVSYGEYNGSFGEAYRAYTGHYTEKNDAYALFDVDTNEEEWNELQYVKTTWLDSLVFIEHKSKDKGAKTQSPFTPLATPCGPFKVVGQSGGK